MFDNKQDTPIIEQEKELINFYNLLTSDKKLN